MITKEKDILNLFGTTFVDYTNWFIRNADFTDNLRDKINTDDNILYSYKYFLKSVLCFKRIPKKYYNSFEFIAYFLYYTQHINIKDF